MSVANDLSNVSATLRNLVQTCFDGEKGFEAAANALDDSTLKAELMRYSTQRRDFANDLQNLLVAQGESQVTSGSVAGALHRGWINIRDAVSKRDNYAVLAECERGEDAAVAEYRKATQAGLPAEFDQVIESQFAAVQETHDRVRALRDSLKRAGV